METLDIKTIPKDDTLLFLAEFSQKPPKGDLLFAFYMKYFFGIDFKESDFERINGKPYLKDRSYYFSHSNKGNFSLLAISFVKDIGCDLEILDFNRSVNRIALRFFSKKEQEYYYGDLRISSNDEEYELMRKKRFYEVWTQKEAYLKLTGEGIAAMKSLDTKDVKISSKITSFSNENFVFSVAKE